MNTIKTTQEFVALSEDEILKALDDFEDQLGDDEEVIADVDPENPIVNEVARLINEYTARFDQYCDEAEDELPEHIFDYEPEIMIERVAYEIFMDAVHDAMQEAEDAMDE